MDATLYFVLLILLLLGALYFLSLVLRNVRSERSALRSSNVTATAEEHGSRGRSPTRKSPAKQAEQVRAVAASDGHSARWNSFVNAKLQSLGHSKPDGLPGIGKTYAAEWAKKGYPTALSVFALFLKVGAKRFGQIAENDIGMRGSHVQDLVSSVESRWSSLMLVGSELAELQRLGGVSDGQHSARWGLFVNAKLSELELSNLPGLGETYLAAWRRAGVLTPTQMLGEFVSRGRAQFEAHCAKEIGMRKVGANDNIYELASALESKWNALSLFGSD